MREDSKPLFCLISKRGAFLRNGRTGLCLFMEGHFAEIVGLCKSVREWRWLNFQRGIWLKGFLTDSSLQMATLASLEILEQNETSFAF